MSSQNKSLSSYILTPLAVVTCLIYMRYFYGVLVFHTFAELFAVMVGVLMFVVVWNSREFTQNFFLTFLGIGYLWVAVLDTFHTFTMTGMFFFDEKLFEITIHFWVYTRILEALLLLTAVKFLKRPINYQLTFSILGVISIIIIWLSFNIHEPKFMSNDGLTTAKIMAEVFVIIILCLAIYFYYQQRKYFATKVLYLFYTSLVLTIFAEISFTLFTDINGSAFVIGHLFKFLSFWMIYKAIVETLLQEPFTMMSKAFNSYDSIPHPSIVIDNDGLIRRINRSAVELVDTPAEKLIDKPVHDYFHPQTISKDNCHLCQSLAKQKATDSELLYYPEHDRWFLYSLAHVTTGSVVTGMVESLTDVTKSKQFEAQLHDQKEQLRIMFETTPIGLLLCKMDGSAVKLNQAFADILGRSIEDTLSLSYWDITPDRYNDMEAKQLQSLEETGVYGPYIKEYIHSKGHLVPVELKGCLLQQGDEQYIWSVVEDITERVDAERRLRRTEKLDAIGQMSAGIAHDFNNILGVILGNIEIMKVKVSLQPEISKYVSSIEKAGQRAAELTNQLLDYSRKKADKLELLNIGDFLSNMQSLIERSLTPHICVSLDIADDLHPVEISAGDFQDALLNVIINSRDAMNGRGTLVIKSMNVELDKEFCRNYPSATSGQYIQLAISDDGKGITTEELDRIFEPFYTSKAPGTGTGMGLAMVFSFIKRSNGIITCDTSPGHGTTFNLYLPAAGADANIIVNDMPIQLQHGAQETILVVDDEQSLLLLTVEQLELLNYRVLSTSSAEEAITILQENSDIDVLLSDIVMPGGINGYELASKARELIPDIKLLLSSGYISEKIKHTQTIRLEHPILKKPYSHAELANALHRVLTT